MFVQIANWKIEKAKGGINDDKVISVRLVANKLDLDKENQEILPEAFNKATVANFLKEGIIDWHHQSIMGKTDEAKAHAIIGKPYDFKWEDGLPAVYANLTKSHPIVKDSILPHLEADQPVFGASVGGSVKKAKSVWDSKVGGLKDQISSINWDHLAICGRPYAVSGGTEVSLVKALGGGDDYEILLNYSDINQFVNEFHLTEKNDELLKALEIGGGTDSATLVGVDALRMQSKVKKKDKELYNNLLLAIKDGDIGPTVKGVKLFFKANGSSEDEAEAKTKGLLGALQNFL